MRLLNTRTKQLEEFVGDVFPNYAILSHTWGPHEVSFADFQLRQKQVTWCSNCNDLSERTWSQGPLPQTDKSPEWFTSGYRKIMLACDFARTKQYDYIWIDTCCIDKSSSSELSEAINSMFMWYRNASICYTYLEDVSVHDAEATFSKARWFTRGWTLQELLAPACVDFLDKDWNFIGSKRSLSDQISNTTGVPARVLLEYDKNIELSSVGQRMSWASGRKTTRIEDEAYSLLGLFGISMPLLYGEGYRAFHRLQQAIVGEFDDHSIFVWQRSPHLDAKNNPMVFAQSPRDFSNAHNVESDPHLHGIGSTCQVTNKGFLLTLPLLYPEQPDVFGECFVGLLNCYREDDIFKCVGIYLLRDSVDHDIFHRVELEPADGLHYFDTTDALKARKQTIYIPIKTQKRSHRYHWQKIDPVKPMEHGFKIISVTSSDPNVRWFPASQMIKIPVDSSMSLIQVDILFWNDDSRVVFCAKYNTRRGNVSVIVFTEAWKLLPSEASSFQLIQDTFLMKHDSTPGKQCLAESLSIENCTFQAEVTIGEIVGQRIERIVIF